MNFKNHPLFLITALALFFPIGLIFLVFSDQQRKRKFIYAAIGLLIFSVLLSLAFFNRPKPMSVTDFQVYATRNKLSLGQSGGLAIISDDMILTDYSIRSTSDVLKLDGTVYTAQQCGEGKIIVRFKNTEKSITISVTDANPTNQTVYLSPTGKRYHKTESHAGKNSIAMLEEEALHSGKTPCLICYKK